MQDLRLPDQVLRQLIGTEPGVPASLPMEGEVPLPAGKQLPEGQGGGAVRIRDEAPAVHPLLFQYALQEAAMEIRSHLADKGGGETQPGGGHGDVGRSASRHPLHDESSHPPGLLRQKEESENDLLLPDAVNLKLILLQDKYHLYSSQKLLHFQARALPTDTKAQEAQRPPSQT